MFENEHNFHDRTIELAESIEHSDNKLSQRQLQLVDNVADELLKSKSLPELKSADQHKLNSLVSEAYLANVLINKLSAELTFEKELPNGKDTDLFIDDNNVYIEVIRPKMEKEFQDVDAGEIITSDDLNKGYTPKTVVGDKTKTDSTEKDSMYFVGVDVSQNISDVVVDALILQDEENLELMTPKKYDVIDGIIIYNSAIKHVQDPDAVLISKNSENTKRFANQLGMKVPDNVPAYIEKENRVLYKYDNERIIPNAPDTISIEREDDGWYIGQTNSDFSRSRRESLLDALKKAEEIRRFQSNIWGNEPINIVSKSGLMHPISIDLDRWINNIESRPIPPWLEKHL